MKARLAIIRRLARGGAAARAWSAFAAAGFDVRTDDATLLTLKGRLLKDLAMQADAGERSAGLRAAAEAYSAAAQLSDDSYPRINAATLVYLRGDKAAAQTLAQDLLDLIAQGRHGGETPYWLEATRAEALLLLDKTAEAQAALRHAVKIAPHAREDRAATLRQFRRIIAMSGGDDGWLDEFAVRPVMHFRGPMALPGSAAEAITAAVTAIAPAMAYGALAAGTDIVAAEAALGVGAELHIILPGPVDLFRQCSVEPLGPDWAERFAALIDAASSVETIDEAGGLTMAAVRLADDMAMGLAVAEALAFGSVPHMLRARWAGGSDAPLLKAPHRLVTIDLPGRMHPQVEALADPAEPVLIVFGQDDAPPRIVPLTQLPHLVDSLRWGDVIDAAVLEPGQSGEVQDSPRLSTLWSLAEPQMVLASRAAALLIMAQCPDCRPVLAGVAEGADGPVEIFELPFQG